MRKLDGRAVLLAGRGGVGGAVRKEVREKNYSVTKVEGRAGGYKSFAGFQMACLGCEHQGSLVVLAEPTFIRELFRTEQNKFHQVDDIWVGVVCSEKRDGLGIVGTRSIVHRLKKKINERNPIFPPPPIL